jgi:hypothetical protein
MKALSQLAMAAVAVGFVLISSGCVVADRPGPDREVRDERWCSNHPNDCDHDRWCADHPNQCGH